MPKTSDTPCSGCGKMLWTGRGSAPADQRLCQPCRAIRRSTHPPVHRRRPRVCDWCSGEFVPTCGGVQRTCSFSCGQRLRYAEGRGFRVYVTTEAQVAAQRDRWQRKNRRRRANLHSVESESYSVAEIAKRDRFRCGLCGSRVSMVLRVPDPKAPVVDHVIPVVRGGSDLRSNVQLAHYRCNAVKGAGGGGEQLALLG